MKVSDLIELALSLLTKSVKDVKDEVIEEVNQAGYLIETHVRRAILDAMDIATKPLIYIGLAVSVSMVSVLLLLYGLSQVVESYLGIKGLGFLLVGLVSLVVSVYAAEKASSQLKQEVSTKDKK